MKNQFVWICAAAVSLTIGCVETTDNTVEAVDRLEQAGHEATWLETTQEESVPEGQGCPSGWADTSQVAIKCGIPTVLVVKTFGGVECATCQEPKCNGPWTSIVTPILCAPGYDLKLNNAGTCQRCVKGDAQCARGGCSGQVCYDTSEPAPITTCEYLPEYACYDSANCGPYGPGGACAWEDTPALTACIDAASEPPKLP